jgi:hypothetical protein
MRALKAIVGQARRCGCVAWQTPCKQKNLIGGQMREPKRKQHVSGDNRMPGSTS